MVVDLPTAWLYDVDIFSSDRLAYLTPCLSYGELWEGCTAKWYSQVFADSIIELRMRCSSNDDNVAHHVWDVCCRYFTLRNSNAGQLNRQPPAWLRKAKAWRRQKGWTEAVDYRVGRFSWDYLISSKSDLSISWVHCDSCERVTTKKFREEP